LPIGKYAEHIECARADRHRTPGAVLVLFEETPKPPIETKSLERKNVGRGERIHPCNSAAADWMWILAPPHPAVTGFPKSC